jgi:hypothetical protein
VLWYRTFLDWIEEWLTKPATPPAPPPGVTITPGAPVLQPPARVP